LDHFRIYIIAEIHRLDHLPEDYNATEEFKDYFIAYFLFLINSYLK